MHDATAVKRCKLGALLVLFSCFGCGASSDEASEESGQAWTEKNVHAETLFVAEDKGFFTSTAVDARGGVYAYEENSRALWFIGGGRTTRIYTSPEGAQAYGLALDDGYLYLKDGGSTQIIRAHLDGSNPVVLSHAGGGEGIASDGKTVAWTKGYGAWALVAFDLASGKERVVKEVAGVEEPARVEHVLVDAEAAYVVENGSPPTDGPSRIVRVGLADGSETVLDRTAHSVHSIAAEGDSIYYVISADHPRGIYELRQVAKRGGTPKTLARTAGWGKIAVDGARIYVADDSGLWAYDKASGVITPIHSQKDLYLDPIGVVRGQVYADAYDKTQPTRPNRIMRFDTPWTVAAR